MAQITIDSVPAEEISSSRKSSLDAPHMPADTTAGHHSARVDSAVETVDDLPTPTQTPTKIKPPPAFSIDTSTTTLDQDPQNDDGLTTSPNPETPTGPITPTTPKSPAHDTSRDSMTSIALSESSLDYDHLSPEQVEDVLATPRVSGARRHLRKVSSLDILQNHWAPPDRPSTLFDSTEDRLHTPMSAIDFQTDRGGWTTEEDSDTNYSLERKSTHTAVDTVDFFEPVSARTDSPSDGPWRKSDGSSSDEESQVNWQALDKTEEQEKEDKDLPEGAEDESTAFLLARLEQENAKFAADPKAASSKTGRRARAVSRPPSMAQLKKLVFRQDSPGPPAIRFSMASDNGIPNEVPPMTELEFWAALVQDYPTTAARLPTLTATKIRAGVPPPLRGVVWASMSGARDKELEESYETLVHEKSPYEGIINKDVGRSFPGVELFRDAEGEGQKMLGRVLKCFSLQDKDIGYCQGLGFLVGPLLMNMGEREAFCVLVRLMDHYSLRPSFLPSLSGLHMRIYQFSALLKQHHARLHDHLASLGIEPAYLSQWFLSCFAVTCPLPMLFRIYDVIFAEGANETVMRVAIALMRRHEEKMLATVEFEEVMQTLLGHELWDCYGGDADELVDDFTSLGDIVTHTRLAELEKEFERGSSETVGQSAGFLPDVQAAASRFLGRLWAQGPIYTPSKPTPATPAHTQNLSVVTLSPPSMEKDTPVVGAYSFFARPTTFLRRSPSKQSINAANESNSSEDSTSTHGSGVVSLVSTAPTDPDSNVGNVFVRESIADSISTRSKPESLFPLQGREAQELNTQIEDLLTAIGEMQREQVQLAAMLQREREERGEDNRVMRQLVGKLRKDDKENRRKTLPARPEDQRSLAVPSTSRPLSVGGRTEIEPQVKQDAPKDEIEVLVEKAQERLESNMRFSVCLETKAQLRTTLARTREELTVAMARSKEVTARLEAAETSAAMFQSESDDLRSEVKELRSRVADEFKARQKMDHRLSEIKAQARSVERKERLYRVESMNEVPTLSRADSFEAGSRKGGTTSLPPNTMVNAGGLRELKLGRRDSSSSIQSLRFRNPTPSRAESVPVIMTADIASYDGDTSPQSLLSETSATPVLSSKDLLGTSPPGLPVPRTGFARRTSSLATKEIIATPQHEPLPDEALLLELVNAKTSEAQAKQEVDELRKALSVAKRKQDEALNQIRAELEAARAATAQASETAQAAKAEAESLRVLQQSAGGMPPAPGAEESPGSGSDRETTPVATPAEEKTSDIAVAKKATTPSSGGGWFWQRRAASKSGITPTEE